MARRRNTVDSGVIVGRVLMLFGVEQAMQMRHEVPHLGVIDGRLGLRSPRRHGGRVIGKQTDDFDLVEIFEFRAVQITEFAAKHKV